MTKRFFIFLIGLVFLGLVVFAQTPQENFQKAGQAELAKKETVLQQIKAEIEKFFDEMASDTIIASQEMRNLKQEVDEFDSYQEEYNKELEFYGLKTAVEISEVIRKHLKIYFEHSKEDGDSTNLYFRDSTKQEIRKYFTERTGQDIRVEKSRDYLTRFLSGFIIGLVAALLCLLCLAVNDVGEIWAGCFTFIVFALILITFLFLF